MSEKHLPLFSVCVFALSLAASSAQASPLFELVGDSSGTGGYNARVTGAGAASTYFNPALLAKAEQQFDVGLLVLTDQIGMTLDGRTHGNVPLSVGTRSLTDKNGNPIPNTTVPTDWLQHGCSASACGTPPFPARPRQGAGSSDTTREYMVLGLVDRLIRDRLVLGLYALIPVGDFTTAHSFYNDEREQFFSNSVHPEMYSDRLTATSLSFGAGSKIIDRLSVGASFTLSLTNIAQAQTYVPNSVDYSKLLISNDIHVRTAVSPHFGIAYDALDWLHLAATVHSEQRFTITMGIRGTVPKGNESETTRTEVHSFLPWTFGAGASVDVIRGHQSVSIAGNLKYALWQDYVDRHGELPGAQGSQFEFKNVLSPTLGVRHRIGDFSSFLDVTYQPTPVPLQTGRENYVDNDRVGAIIGGDYHFTVLDLPFKAGLQFQTQRLLYRHQTKDDSLLVDELPDDAIDSQGKPVPGAKGLQTNNPGWPGFASEGWIVAGAVTVALLY